MSWACPVCRSTHGNTVLPVPPEGTEGGVDAAAFRPSAEQFGRAADAVVRCVVCGHGSLNRLPAANAVDAAYAAAADPVSLREERGQVETARRALAEIERHVTPGRVVDIGCWTGSFLIAARERGWEPFGLEPSAWASDRARQRGLDVRTGALADHWRDDSGFRLAAMCDVLEHLAAPGHALDAVAALLEPGGVLYVTLPDAGSRLARLMGRRWWSLLPMHVQYFTRPSLRRLLADRGFEVRSVSTHAKVFTARYYAERLGGYSPLVRHAAVGVVSALRQADRLIAPDFRDRMAVIAVKREK